ncbi:hypothetical protein [Paracoccus sp. PAR01]|uniref:hypothetical protein n=1 Tax=Paracoccus sp. PAR01 TaxID=2769282 RepID=UPI00177E1FCA|nr:hypothetical protein [Paracoccus sp. PAR01]MBD9529041.1 hypothetical protein [Paracoccus sp. PAR01]
MGASTASVQRDSLLARPMPPAEQVEGFEAWFGPAPDLAEWALASIIADGALL